MAHIEMCRDLLGYIGVYRGDAEEYGGYHGF